MGNQESKVERAIKNAYIDLMRSKAYNAITVRELVEHAEVARSTFYSHYGDIIEVLEDMEGKLLELLCLYRSERDAPGDELAGQPFECVQRWFEACFEHSHVLLALTGVNGDPYFARRLRNKVRRELNLMMDEDHVANDRLRPYYVEMLASAYVGLALYAISVEEPAKRLTPLQLAQIINHTRVAYFKEDARAPHISDEALFGPTGKILTA